MKKSSKPKAIPSTSEPTMDDIQVPGSVLEDYRDDAEGDPELLRKKIEKYKKRQLDKQKKLQEALGNVPAPEPAFDSFKVPSTVLEDFEDEAEGDDDLKQQKILAYQQRQLKKWRKQNGISYNESTQKKPKDPEVSKSAAKPAPTPSKKASSSKYTSNRLITV